MANYKSSTPVFKFELCTYLRIKNRAMCVSLQTKARQLNRFECDTSLISFMTKRLLQYVLGYYSSPYFHLITPIKRMVTIGIFSLNLTSTTLFSEPSIRKTDQNPINTMTRVSALVLPWSSIAFANNVNAISQLFSWLIVSTLFVNEIVKIYRSVNMIFNCILTYLNGRLHVA